MRASRRRYLRTEHVGQRKDVVSAWPLFECHLREKLTRASDDDTLRRRRQRACDSSDRTGELLDHFLQQPRGEAMTLLSRCRFDVATDHPGQASMRGLGGCWTAIRCDKVR